MAAVVSLCRSPVLRLHAGLRMAARGLASQGGYLVDDPKYAFLKELGLQKHNCGVFHGKWKATGEVRVFPIAGLLIDAWLTADL